MKARIKKVKRIIDDREGDLRPISDEIFYGIKEGIRLGIADGLKQGVKEGLEECLSKGFTNVGRNDVIDICKSIQENIIRNGMKEGSKVLFVNPTREYVDSICPKIGEELRSGDMIITEEETGFIRDMAMKSEQKVMAEMIQKLPKNPLFKPIIDGIKLALEETLGENLKECEKKILAEMGSA